MIKSDQPTIFGAGVIAIVSSVADGNMKRGGQDEGAVHENRRKFLSRHIIAMQSTVLCGVTYDREDFAHYEVVRGKDKGRGMLPDTDSVIADGIATDEKRCALFLPLADCIGAILYDSSRKALMVSHLGRHSTEQYGAKKSVEFMKYKFGSQPEDIMVWLSPAPNGQDYPLWKRENKSFHDVTRDDLLSAGIKAERIEISPVDTVTNREYFSHSEFLQGHRDLDGRFAIVAMMR